jgi:hypothetical protein
MPGTCHHGAALLPLAFRRRRLSAAARAALVRPEPVRTGQLSATTQPDEHEHQDDEAERADRAGNRGDSSRPVPVKARGLPPHPPMDDGAEPEPKSAYGVPSGRLLTEPRLDPGSAPIG